MTPENPPSHNGHDDQIVCPKCLHLNTPDAAFCTECGAPIGMVANIDPIQQIYSEGFGMRSAVTGPPSRIILIGVWLLFLSILGTALITFRGAIINLKSDSFYAVIFLSVMLLISTGILYRVTRNYLIKSREARQPERP